MPSDATALHGVADALRRCLAEIDALIESASRIPAPTVEIEVPVPGERRRVTSALLAKVADIYANEADRPAAAVRAAFGCSERTAFRYIKLAREAGALSAV
jgi:hypothetical protein